MIRRHIANLALLLGSCALVLVVAEGLVRIFDPHVRDHVIPGGFFVIDGALGWRLKPDTTVTHRTRYFNVTYTTNGLGYRDSTRASSPGPRARILVFGDSQVFGWGVPEPRRFSNLLEAEHPGLEVWNLGVPGYGLDQELLAYEGSPPGWAEIVVLYVSRATLERMKAAKLYQKYKPRFALGSSDTLQLTLPPTDELPWTALLYRVLSPWYLPYFLERRLAMLPRGPRPTPDGPPKEVDRPALDRLTQAVLDRAARVAQERRQRLLLLVYLPPPRREALLDFCGSRGIPAVAVESPKPLEDFVFGGDDPHWNSRGHRWVADQVSRQWPGLDRVAPRR